MRRLAQAIGFGFCMATVIIGAVSLMFASLAALSAVVHPIAAAAIVGFIVIFAVFAATSYAVDKTP